MLNIIFDKLQSSNREVERVVSAARVGGARRPSPHGLHRARKPVFSADAPRRGEVVHLWLDIHTSSGGSETTEGQHVR